MAKILIIEDDPYVLRFYENVFRLSDHNYQLITAQSGEEGLYKIKNEIPELILLDIVMPGKNGLAVLKELKADSTTQNIPVIILTNISDTEIIRQCSQLGATDFLIKSDTEPQQLVQRIEEYLATIKT